MTPAALENLKNIGQQLDSDIYPTVHNGGFVMPHETTNPVTRGKVNQYERQRLQRQKTTARKPRTGPRDGITARQGPPSETPSLIRTELHTQYESELNAVHEAYPKTLIWHQPEGMLVFTESALLNGLDQAARFLVAIPYTKDSVAKGWGFWGISSIGVEWIGPRHTNFPDGSICAFEPSDGTWNLGDPLTQLLDLYSLWALRHLYMKILGRWPGYQSIHFPYERILELRPDEHCGCQHSGRLYGECCQKNDTRRNILADAIRFILICNGGVRKPPPKVTNFVLTHSNPPGISELLHLH